MVPYSSCILNLFRVIADRYELSEQIGTGGMATVWKATDTLLGRQVAVKRLLPHLATDQAGSRAVQSRGKGGCSPQSSRDRDRIRHRKGRKRPVHHPRAH